MLMVKYIVDKIRQRYSKILYVMEQTHIFAIYFHETTIFTFCRFVSFPTFISSAMFSINFHTSSVEG